MSIKILKTILKLPVFIPFTNPSNISLSPVTFTLDSQGGGSFVFDSPAI